MVNALNDNSTNIIIYDPWANAKEVVHEFNIASINKVPKEKFDAIVFAVDPNAFSNLDFESLKKENSISYNIKGWIDRDLVD